MRWVEVAAAFGVDLSAIVLVYRALGWGRRGRQFATVAAALAVAVAPRLASGPKSYARFLLALVSVVLIAKFYDLAVGARRRGAVRPGLVAYLTFLPNIFGLVYRALDGEPCPTRPADRGRLALGVLGLAAGLAVNVAVFSADWSRWPFALEHPVKVLGLFALLLPLDAVGIALWRLAGGRGRQLMRHPYFASTPSDFWRRYNRPVNHFLQKDVFGPAGGRSAPAAATLLAFLVSAALHEYLFSVALGRVEGFQSAFFLTQGLAVAATQRLRLRGFAAAFGAVGTLAFNLSTSVLFFASFGGVVPFYSPGRPDWLRPRG